MEEIITDYLYKRFDFKEDEAPRPIKYANVEGWWWLFIYNGSTRDFVIDIIVLESNNGDQPAGVNVMVRAAESLQELPKDHEAERAEIEEEISEEIRAMI